MKHSKIEWTDHTFNPWEGCTKVSEGCRNCYAEARNARFGGGAAPNWGPGAPRRRTSVQNWNQPIKWNDAPMQLDDARGHRPTRVFCASLADWLDNEVPIEWLADLLDLIRRTPNLDWLLLTKRPANWLERLSKVSAFVTFSPRHHDLFDWLCQWNPRYKAFGGNNGAPFPPANVWIGTTVENQEMADKRIPELLRIPARVRFLSCEPLLEEVDISFGLPVTDERMGHDLVRPGENINWVICGGESGHGARPMHPDWARSLRDQCAAAGVPFLFKQWGNWIARSQYLRAGYEGMHVHLAKATAQSKVMRRDGSIDESLGYAPATNDSDSAIYNVGKSVAGRLLDGAEHNEFPAVQKGTP